MLRDIGRGRGIIGRTDREQIRSRMNNNDCRTFRPQRPLSTAYKTVLYYPHKMVFYTCHVLHKNAQVHARAC